MSVEMGNEEGGFIFPLHHYPPNIKFNKISHCSFILKSDFHKARNFNIKVYILHVSSMILVFFEISVNEKNLKMAWVYINWGCMDVFLDIMTWTHWK